MQTAWKLHVKFATTVVSCLLMLWARASFMQVTQLLDDSIAGDILNLCSRADAHARIHDVPGSVFIICMHEAFSCLLHACVQAA